MSFKYTALALDHGPTDSAEKLLLLALCDRSDESGVCWPTRADLMQRTGASYATISRKLRMLEVQGWIQRQRRFNASTRFRINVSRLHRLEAEATAQRKTHVPKGFEPFEDEVAQPIENKGTVHSEPTSVHCDTHMSSQRTPNLSKNQSKNLEPAALSLSSLGKYGQSCLRDGKPVYLSDGTALKPGTAIYRQLDQQRSESERV